MANVVLATWIVSVEILIVGEEREKGILQVSALASSLYFLLRPFLQQLQLLETYKHDNKNITSAN